MQWPLFPKHNPQTQSQTYFWSMASLVQFHIYIQFHSLLGKHFFGPSFLWYNFWEIQLLIAKLLYRHHEKPPNLFQAFFCGGHYKKSSFWSHCSYIVWVTTPKIISAFLFGMTTCGTISENHSQFIKLLTGQNENSGKISCLNM